MRGRKADHLKKSKKKLFKSYEKLTPSRGTFFGGTSSYGPHKKTETAKKTRKEPTLKYVGPHHQVEYFALEILLQLGIETPKARISAKKDWRINHGLVITNNLAGYLPMNAIRHDVTLITIDAKKTLQSLRDRYEIDIEKQVILDHQEEKAYKISGHLFAADIACLLIGDLDFQPEGFNLGVVQRGNSFYAAAIDKDKASLLREQAQHYEQLLKKADQRIFNDRLFQSRSQEQIIAMLYAINQGKDKNNFHDIFFNPRIADTLALNEIAEQCMNTLFGAAKLLIDHYKEEFGEDFLDQFSKREQIRHEIIDTLFSTYSAMFAEYDAAEQAIIRINLVEDLRGPYYTELLSNQKFITENDKENAELLKKILIEVQAELHGNLTASYHELIADRVAKNNSDRAPQIYTAFANWSPDFIDNVRPNYPSNKEEQNRYSDYPENDDLDLTFSDDEHDKSKGLHGHGLFEHLNTPSGLDILRGMKIEGAEFIVSAVIGKDSSTDKEVIKLKCDTMLHAIALVKLIEYFTKESSKYIPLSKDHEILLSNKDFLKLCKHFKFNHEELMQLLPREQPHINTNFKA